MPYVYVLRHGETDCNKAGILQGQTDTKLNFTGFRQMVKLAKATASLEWERSYCSPLLRARQSHAIVHRVRTHVACDTAKELAEMCFGTLQGRSYAELDFEYPSVMECWRRDPWSARFPGGETLSEVDDRVARFLKRSFAECHGGSLLISAHGVVNRLIILRLMGIEPPHFWTFDVRNAAMAAIDVEKRSLRRFIAAGG